MAINGRQNKTGLPRFDPSKSDGCSVPHFLRPFLSVIERPEVRAICVDHDEAYYYGGSEAERLRADLKFALGLLDVSVDLATVEKMYEAVRWFGGPQFKIKGVSWAYGNERFVYTNRE